MSLKILLLSIVISVVLYFIHQVMANSLNYFERMEAALCDDYPKRVYISFILFLISILNLIIQIIWFIVTL